MSLIQIFRTNAANSVILVVISSCYLQYAMGQEPTGKRTSTVSVSATNEIDLAPEKIRLQMFVRAESREGENAIKLLQKHQERVTKELLVLGADPSSIEFSKIVLSVGYSVEDDQDIGRRMMWQQAIPLPQMRNAIPGNARINTDEGEGGEPQQIFVASSILLVEWTLKNGLDDAAILLPSRLRLAIDEKDFKGKKLKEERSPAEQTPHSRIATAIYPNAGRPVDLQMHFVAKLSESQEEDAIAAAYKKALSQASMLAKATGRQLGSMRTIASNMTSMLPGYNPGYITGVNSQMASFARKNVREVASEDPNSLKQYVSINVSFDLD